jgi:hypothetical protein
MRGRHRAKLTITELLGLKRSKITVEQPEISLHFKIRRQKEARIKIK